MDVALLVAALLRINSRSFNILDPSFTKQMDFILHPSRRKALWCTRRAAKSYTAGLYLTQTAHLFPNCNCLYLGLTRLSARGIIWKDILKEINQKNQLGMDFRDGALTVSTAKDSVIHITGVDTEEDEMRKLLGKKWKLVVIDEAQSYSIDMRALIYGVLGPAVVDQGGTICLMGTSGNVTQGLFYDVTTRAEPGWDVFEWTAYDNPYVAKQWAEEIEDIKKNRPMFMETALFKQWYLNQWVVDENAKVYKFKDDRNTVPHLPPGISDWHYVLGVDLAHSPDSTAFVVGCYHESTRVLYLVMGLKQTEMDITDVANKIRSLDNLYHFEVKVIDSANKQAVAELNNRHDNLNLIAAEKPNKADYIMLMNDDFIQGYIKLLPDTEELKKEYDKLVWLTDASGNVKEPKKENPTIHQDLADAAYYTWRFCYSYLFADPVPFKDKSLQSVWESEHITKLQELGKQKQNPNELDLHWDKSFHPDHEEDM